MTQDLTHWVMKAEMTINYDIISCNNLLDPNNKLLLTGSQKQPARRIIMIDHTVYQLYSSAIHHYFTENNVSTEIVKIVSGEENKTFDCYQSILSQLDTFEIDRRSDPIIAIGGGVLTDIVGFVASTYRRSVPFIKVPTTLMGYVDASIGIKTGVNFNNHKNRVGSFYPPLSVLLDKSFFLTLSKRHILNGIGEIIKMAVIKNEKLFQLLETHALSSTETKFQDQAGITILNHAISDMIDELQPNLFEADLMRAVDFGHTFSYVFEMEKKIDVLHGEAVVIDVALSSILSFKRGFLSEDSLNRILALIVQLNFPVFHGEISTHALWEAVIERTHHRDGLQKIPLPRNIGECIFVNDIQFHELESAVEFLTNRIKKESKKNEKYATV